MGSEIERRHLRAGFKLDWGELSRLERRVNQRGPWFRFADSVPLPRAISIQRPFWVCLVRDEAKWASSSTLALESPG